MGSLRICLIGGIFGANEDYRRLVRWTPETTLATGLRDLGYEVATFSHYDDLDRGSFDIIHVHHLAWGAVVAATDSRPARFVYTAHARPARSLISDFVTARADAIVALYPGQGLG